MRFSPKYIVYMMFSKIRPSTNWSEMEIPYLFFCHWRYLFFCPGQIMFSCCQWHFQCNKIFFHFFWEIVMTVMIIKYTKILWNSLEKHSNQKRELIHTFPKWRGFTYYYTDFAIFRLCISKLNKYRSLSSALKTIRYFSAMWSSTLNSK